MSISLRARLLLHEKTLKNQVLSTTQTVKNDTCYNTWGIDCFLTLHPLSFVEVMEATEWWAGWRRIMSVKYRSTVNQHTYTSESIWSKTFHLILHGLSVLSNCIWELWSKFLFVFLVYCKWKPLRHQSFDYWCATKQCVSNSFLNGLMIVLYLLRCVFLTLILHYILIFTSKR